VRKGLIGGPEPGRCAGDREAQRIAVTESRLHIPLLLGLDVITVSHDLPIPLAEAATWTPRRRRARRAAAAEAAAAGVNWTFAPWSTSRAPAVGRIAEPGEDPYLGSPWRRRACADFRERTCRARSGDGHGQTLRRVRGAEAGRDYNPWTSRRTLRRDLPTAFRAAWTARGSFMTSFNEIAASRATQPLAVTTLLRDEWKFRGSS